MNLTTDNLTLVLDGQIKEIFQSQPPSRLTSPIAQSIAGLSPAECQKLAIRNPSTRFIDSSCICVILNGCKL
uniref:Uncharacterized protein n=1 Tax=Kalanchoe fedtschenkoi TaxID=63787 RepID=A0A7N0T162_KALFE